MAWLWGSSKKDDDEEEDDDYDEDEEEFSDDEEELEEADEDESSEVVVKKNDQAEEYDEEADRPLPDSDEDLVSISMETVDESFSHHEEAAGAGATVVTPNKNQSTTTTKANTTSSSGGFLAALWGRNQPKSQQEQEPQQSVATNKDEEEGEAPQQEAGAVEDTTPAKISRDGDNDDDDDDGREDIRGNKGENTQDMSLQSPENSLQEVASELNVMADWNNTNNNHHHHKAARCSSTTMVNPQEDDDYEENDNEDDQQPGELVLQGAIPEHVAGTGSRRDRVHSTVTHEGDVDEDDGEMEDTSVDGPQELEEEEEEEDEEISNTLQDNQSLMILAAEHDRADIINNVLAACQTVDPNESGGGNGGEGGGELTRITTKEALLHGGLPPLHVAILYGSMNAINCLLRVGADPSVRPNLATMAPALIQSVQNARSMDGVTAWELVFGTNSHTNPMDKNSNNNGKNAKNIGIKLPQDKKAAIQHAFAAEALRCIGSDEVERLQQLVKAGVPSTLDLGGKSLYDWTVEMGATQCQQLLRPSDDNHSEEQGQESAKPSAVLDRRDKGKNHDESTIEEESLSSLRNRLDELDSLSRALSTCLDNLAEEVSVCHGLLLMGGGASALAAHVKNLKAQRERKQEELMQLNDVWESSEDELAYWIREAGGADLASAILSSSTTTVTSGGGGNTTIPLPPPVSTLVSSSTTHKKALRSSPTTDQANDDGAAGATCNKDDDDDTTQITLLQSQIVASEAKVRKLRVAITDLSEENTGNLAEVERRGLTGGIQLVRNLRDEIRQVEFDLDRAQERNVQCRSKISRIQAAVQQQQRKTQQQQQQQHSGSTTTDASEEQLRRRDNVPSAKKDSTTTPTSAVLVLVEEEEMSPSKVNATTAAEAPHTLSMADSSRLTVPYDQSGTTTSDPSAATPTAMADLSDSERIATGQSTAIAISSHKDGRGYFPLSLWEILLRIMGMRGGGRGGRGEVLIANGSAVMNHLIRNGNKNNNSNVPKRPNGPQRQPAVII